MKKIVTIEFTEQSKAVVASTKIVFEMEEVNGVIPSNSLLLEEAKELFDSAQQHALEKSMLRNK